MNVCMLALRAARHVAVMHHSIAPRKFLDLDKLSQFQTFVFLRHKLVTQELLLHPHGCDLFVQTDYSSSRCGSPRRQPLDSLPLECVRSALNRTNGGCACIQPLFCLVQGKLHTAKRCLGAFPLLSWFHRMLQTKNDSWKSTRVNDLIRQIGKKLKPTCSTHSSICL